MAKKSLSELYKLNMELTRKKLKESLTDDILIIQAISSIEEMEKACSLLVKRLREWYELYCPEFSKSIQSQERFTQLVSEKSRDDLLKEIKVKETFGTDMKKEDVEALRVFAKEINSLYEFRKQQEVYLEKLMKRCCPNVMEVAGKMIGAKLIALASGLKRLSEFPASTVQLLGAEKALFRHIKNKRFRPPKYGILIQHSLVNAAKQKDKGKVARALGDKISIASKVDYFKGEFIGKKLREGLEKKFSRK